MNRFLHILILLSLIAAVLLLDNYWEREITHIKELMKIEKMHQRQQANILKQNIDPIFFDESYLDSLQPKLAMVDSFIDPELDKASYLNLKDIFDSNFIVGYPNHIWNASPEIIELQTLEFVNHWMEAQLDSSRFAKWRNPQNFEMVIGYIERNDDSIQFGSHYILPLDSPYIDPWNGEPIVVDSLKLY